MCRTPTQKFSLKICILLIARCEIKFQSKMDAKPLEISSTTTEPSSTTEHLFKANGSILESGLFQFGVLDYAFFVLLISLSALIGIYYGFFSKHKQNTTAEYILGGRSMQIIPVATSMIATLVIFILKIVISFSYFLFSFS